MTPFRRVIGLFAIELAGAPASALMHRVHRVRLFIGASALGSVWLMPAPLRTRALLFAYVAIVYIPWSFLISQVSWSATPAFVPSAMLFGDLSIVLTVQLTVPAARFVSLFGYLLVCAFYAHVSGRRAGFIIAGVATAASVLREAVASGPSIDVYTIVMFVSVLPSMVMLIEGVSRSQRDAAVRLQRLYGSLQGVSSSVDVHAVLTTVAREAAGALGAAGGVVLQREGDDLVELGGTYGDLGRYFGSLRVGAFLAEEGASTPAARTIVTGSVVSIEDAGRFEGAPAWRNAAAAMNVGSVLCAPIREDSALLLWFRRQRPFTEFDKDLLLAFAEQASVALDRARAFDREREAARKARELDDLKSDFVSTVSHELRTPLTAIGGFAHMLDVHWANIGDDLRRDVLHRVSRNAQELDDLIDQLLDFSRLEKGIVHTEPRPVELGAELRAIAEKHKRVLLSAQRIDVEVPDGLTAMAEPKAFQRIVDNLLSNAAKFSPPGSRIRITASELPGEMVLVSVEDEGIGMARHERERIFERFYRAERGDSAPDGTGVGLAIVKQFVEALGGRVWVESEPGAGSVFRFTLPRGPVTREWSARPRTAPAARVS